MTKKFHLPASSRQAKIKLIIIKNNNLIILTLDKLTAIFYVKINIYQFISGGMQLKENGKKS